MNNFVPDIGNILNNEIIISELTVQSNSFFKISDDEICSICLDYVFPTEGTSRSENGEGDGIVTNCGHSFHKQCLEKSFISTKQLKCPMCRKPGINQGLCLAIPDKNCKNFFREPTEPIEASANSLPIC